MTDALQIDVIGPLRIRSDVQVEVRRPAQRRLLSILALANGQRVSTNVLIDRYWPDGPPTTGRAAIQTHVAALRRLVGDSFIITEGYGYRLNLDKQKLDVAEFTELAARANSERADSDWPGVLESTSVALGIWRGIPFEELADDEFARAEIIRLEEIRLELLEHHAESLIALDRAEEALPELEALVVDHPYRERLWEHLMTARYRLGRNTEALRAFQELSSQLAEIGVEPGEPLRRLEEKILLHDQSLTRTKHNLPTELDSFIGRETEMDEIAKLLADHRLVTLTGAGGSGKTRLAVHLARQSLDSYPDGIWYVELADIDDSSLIPTEIAQTIGIKSDNNDVIDTLITALTNERCLIILDNCEHLVEATAVVTRRLLEGCPNLSALATSRSPLRIPGETAYTVPGLTLPNDKISEANAFGYDGIRLFVERATAAGSFALTGKHLVAITSICRRLDGMPLAIELAAVRTATLTPDAIAARLDDRFRLLTDGSPTAPAKHQTLEAVIDWSYQLLSPEEQTVLNRLSVFRGGFDLEMAEQVAGGNGVDPHQVVPLVASLAAKSLINTHDWEQEGRYRLLETVREYGIQRLEERGEYQTARHHHFEWALGFADEFWRRVYEGGRERRVERIHLEFDNLMAAIEWSDTIVDPAANSRLLSTVSWHWWDLGYLSQQYEALSAAVALCPDPVRRAELAAQLSHSAWTLNRSDEAWLLAEEAYKVLREQPPTPALVKAATRFASLHWMLLDHDAEAGIPISEEAVRLAVEIGNILMEMEARGAHATLLVSSGMEEEGLEELERMLDLVEKAGDSEYALGHYHSAITTLMTVRSARRTRPRQIVDLMVEVAESKEQMTRIAADWMAFVYMQTGEFEKAAEILELDASSPHLEAIDELSMLIPRAFLLWMQGRLEPAAEDIRACEAIGVNPRWYHDFLAVKAEIAADRGFIEEARDAAQFYLAFDVAASEAVKKLGTLHPMVRAEVEAALNGGPNKPDIHARHAREGLATMEQIRTQFPPPSSGSYMAETHDTHFTFARAEVSRLDGFDPEMWKQALEQADFIYYRLYAQWRLAEALLQSQQEDEGATHLRAAREQASRVGAGLLTNRIEQTARLHDVDLN